MKTLEDIVQHKVRSLSSKNKSGDGLVRHRDSSPHEIKTQNFQRQTLQTLSPRLNDTFNRILTDFQPGKAFGTIDHLLSQAPTELVQSPKQSVTSDRMIEEQHRMATQMLLEKSR